jgi:hypothetical protein
LAVCHGGFVPQCAAELDVDVRVENRTGAEKRDWPVFLKVYTLFGNNLDLAAVNPKGFHVFDAAGGEVPHMLRSMPPAWSIGNADVIVIIPRLADGAAAAFRVTNTQTDGRPQQLDLLANPNNLLPNPGFEANAAGVPEGYKQISDKGGTISYETAVKHSGKQSLLLTFAPGTALTLQSLAPVAFQKEGRYHFSLWARTENMAYNGYGFNGSASVRFNPPALRGDPTITLRGTRDWYCYSFSTGGADSDGISDAAARAQTATVRKGEKTEPAEIWQKSGGKAHFLFGAFQEKQPFLLSGLPGRVWIDDILLIEQPLITINRQKNLERVGVKDLVTFSRPVDAPRTAVFPHEAVERLESFAMPGERRQFRFGIHALKPLKAVEVAISPVTGPAGALGKESADLELLDDFIQEYSPLPKLDAGQRAEYLLGIDVPRGTPPGALAATIQLKADGAVLRELPLRLEVLPVEAPTMEGYWVGGIYNIGMGLPRNDSFYACYGKARFNYLLLFDYLFTTMQAEALDFQNAQAQVDKIVKLAHAGGGIGLYREPNMSEDQPRKWYQIASGKPAYAGPYKTGTDAKFKAAYQALVRQAHEYGKKHNWPPLLYMVTDEPDRPQDVDPAMGWLNEALPDAITLADAQCHDMLKTWQWYNLPVCDDPVDWTGPAVYAWIKQNARRFGICGTCWSFETARYQPGLMLASSGACYWHWWHTGGPFEERKGKVVRSHTVAALSEGFTDLRYFVALKEHIGKAKTGAKAEVAAEAEKYLAEIFAFATADHDRHLMPYNGVPLTWGDVRFYDRWRAAMKDYILKLR